MTRRPLGSVNCSNTIRPAPPAPPAAPAWPASVPGRTTRSANSLRMWARLHREERQSVGFEDRLLLRFRQRQGQELIDVLPEILHTGAGPIGAPQHAVHDLRQAGKVLQQLGGRNA